MNHLPQLAQVTERVERLLERHHGLLQECRLLQQQVQELTSERDLLLSRLRAARSRIDALVDQLPQADKL